MSGAEYEALLHRRRIWGVPPDVVERLAADCQREQAALRTRIKELEGRIARATTERDEAQQTVAALQERVARLEQENQEIANRPETVREEAVRFVVDAWAEAQMLREQTRQEIAEAATKAREEVATMQRESMEERQRYEAKMTAERQRAEAEMAEARQRYETEISTLRARRLKAIEDLESLGESLLHQATRGAVPPPAAPDDAAPTVAASPPATVEAPPMEPPAPIVIPAPIAHEGAAEDQMLARALDDLEAILNTSRKPNSG